MLVGLCDDSADAVLFEQIDGTFSVRNRLSCVLVDVLDFYPLVAVKRDVVQFQNRRLSRHCRARHALCDCQRDRRNADYDFARLHFPPS